MGFFSFFYPFSLILILSLYSSHFISANNNNNHVDLIAQTCKSLSRTDPNVSYRFCRNSLQADPHSRRVRNLRDLGFISLRLLRHNVTETRVHIRNLLKTTKKKKIDPFIREGLDDCLEVYSDAIPTLREAIKDYKAKLYADCNVKVSSVLDASTTCEDGFKEKDGVVSPLTKRNSNAFRLSAIALFIINLLDK